MAPQTDVGKIKTKYKMYNLDIFAPSYLIIMKPVTFMRKKYISYNFHFISSKFEKLSFQ